MVARFFGSLKSQDVKPDSTTAILRAIYQTQNRGQDTVIVIGDYLNEDSGIVSINPRGGPGNSKQPNRDAIGVNAQGRKNTRENSQTNPETILIPRDARGKGDR